MRNTRECVRTRSQWAAQPKVRADLLSPSTTQTGESRTLDDCLANASSTLLHDAAHLTQASNLPQIRDNCLFRV